MNDPQFSGIYLYAFGYLALAIAYFFVSRTKAWDRVTHGIGHALYGVGGIVAMMFLAALILGLFATGHWIIALVIALFCIR
jgi:ABC-type phosphate transport system permease subunit